MPKIASSSSGQDRVYLEVNKEIMDAIEFGQEVKVAFRGEVKSMESREVTDYEALSDDQMDKLQPEDYPKKVRHEIDVEIGVLSVYPVNEFAELTEEEDDEY